MSQGYPHQTPEWFARFRNLAKALRLGATLALFAACSSPPTDRGTRGLDRAERFVTAPRSATPAEGTSTEQTGGPNNERVVAQVNGSAIRAGDIRERTLELAGATALSEIVLEKQLEAMCREAGVTIDETDLARERALIERAMIDAGVAPGSSEARRLIRDVRTARGLGETRYAAMISRNAMLRALVDENATPNEEELRRAYDARYGEKRVARLITVPTLSEASRVSKLATDGEDFSDLAARFSTDVSAARGGLLEPISPHDERYPRAVREAIGALAVGGVSGAVSLETGFAVVKLVRLVPPAPDAPGFAQARSALAEQVRLRRERILMGDLASRLRARATGVSVFDPALQRAWESRPRR